MATRAHAGGGKAQQPAGGGPGRAPALPGQQRRHGQGGGPHQHRIAERGVAACWADPTKAERELGWRASRDLQTMLLDTWRWQSLNPDGYAGGEPT